jgi:signal transduction histidine kinase
MRVPGRLADPLANAAAEAPSRRWQAGLLTGFVLVAAVTGVIALLRNPEMPVSGLEVLYLLAILPVALTWGTAVAFAVSVMSAAAVAYFYLPPIHSLGVAKPADLLALGVFMLTALVVSELAAGSRRQARVAQRLAEEQTALRRIATLVAAGMAPTELFSAVADEVASLLAADSAFVGRLGPDGFVTVLAVGGRVASELTAGDRWQVEPAMPIRSSVASPILVEGQRWGVIVATTGGEPLSPEAERRMLDFTELVAIAIANADSRSELAASRARIVAASDETRRRIERDLHDGVQQRLVTLAIELRAVQAALPAPPDEFRVELAAISDGLEAVLEDLRRTSRGIHPAILYEGGLRPALRALARQSPVPVALDVRVEGRLPGQVEAGAYYVVSEMLTNVAKHAQATAVHIDVEACDSTLHVVVRDDGIGGADPAGGSGLVGLADRVAALGGVLTLESPRGSGTSLTVELPLGGDAGTRACPRP